MLFTELNTKVLLDIYKCLDVIDSINLAGTCIRLRDVAQLHYHRYTAFNLYNFLLLFGHKRHNRIGAVIVLRCIGAFISALVADLDENSIGAGVAASIRKYCRNVKSLKIVDRNGNRNPYTAYSEWFKALKLEKLTIPAKDTFVMDLSATTTLTELHIYSGQNHRDLSKQLNSIVERNCNIRKLSIPATWGYCPEIFLKVKSLKYFGFMTGIRLLKQAANNLEVKDLEKVEIEFVPMSSTSLDSFDHLNILLKKLAANASMLTDLSIEISNSYHDDDTVFLFDKCPLPLSLFNLTSLRLDVMCPSLYRDLPKMQPNLKHLDLVIYDYGNGSYSDDSMDNAEDFTRQIISLIKNLKKLEIFHIKIKDDKPAVSKELRSESVIRQIFDACSKNRPTLQMYVQYDEIVFSFLGVKLNFMERKSTVTHIPFKLNYLSDSLKHQSLLRCCY